MNHLCPYTSEYSDNTFYDTGKFLVPKHSFQKTIQPDDYDEYVLNFMFRVPS